MLREKNSWLSLHPLSRTTGLHLGEKKAALYKDLVFFLEKKTEKKFWKNQKKRFTLQPQKHKRYTFIEGNREGRKIRKDAN